MNSEVERETLVSYFDNLADFPGVGFLMFSEDLHQILSRSLTGIITVSLH